MANVKKVGNFRVVTFSDAKHIDIDVTKEKFDTKVFDEHDNRVGFFREIIITNFDGATTTHRTVIQPHEVLDQLGLKGEDFAF